MIRSALSILAVLSSLATPCAGAADVNSVSRIAEDAIRTATGSTDFELEGLAVTSPIERSLYRAGQRTCEEPAILLATPDGNMRKLELDRMESTSVERPDQ